MPLLNSIIKWMNIKRIYAIDLFRMYPVNTQMEVFRKLMKTAQDTEWGKKYQYSSIQTYEQYKERVPIQTYEELKPYVDRLMKGEQKILWPSDIRWYAKSSGTTNDKSKYIPVSAEALEDCHMRAGKDIIAIYTSNYPEHNLFKGKGLTIGGSHQVNEFSNDSFYGDLSAILIENLPFWAEFYRTPSTKIALLPDFEEKIQQIAKIAVNDNVTSIAGVPSWNLNMLKFVMEYTGKSNVLEIWPNLELFLHGGVNFEPYRKQFESIIPSDQMHYMESYNASEGYFALQDDPNTKDMLLMLDYGIFYEFIKLEDLELEHPNTYHVGEVEKNVDYAMLISTNGGLWRYMIGDTVRFTSLFPHKIVISGRTKQFINVFGEELMVDNTEKAILMACEKTNAQVKEYSVAPIFMDTKTKGGHEWVIEFAIEPENKEFFSTVLDNSLKSLNSDYEAKRFKNLTLEFPKIHFARKDLFLDWMKSRGKIGGQNKVPRLSNERKHIEELLKLNH